MLHNVTRLRSRTRELEYGQHSACNRCFYARISSIPPPLNLSLIFLFTPRNPARIPSQNRVLLLHVLDFSRFPSRTQAFPRSFRADCPTKFLVFKTIETQFKRRSTGVFRAFPSPSLRRRRRARSRRYHHTPTLRNGPGSVWRASRSRRPNDPGST